MVYQVRIGVDKKGRTTIGSDSVNEMRRNKNLSDSEKVYGSQIGHRVAVKDGRNWKIMTPSDAKKKGLGGGRRFPGRR